MSLLGPVALIVLATASSAQGVAALCSASSGPRQAPLVELYTSQGCSSCPPADRWLSSLKPRVDAGELVPVALHVGYWDYIGWKDPFARREFNERQRMLARGGTVYTPGVFLQGREWRQWGGTAAIERAGQATALASIDLEVTARSAGSVSVRAKTAGKADALFIAVTQDGLQTDVKSGENRGTRLGNDFVARAWSGPLRAPGDITVSLELPKDAPLGSLALVAFVQDGAEVQQALRLPLADCR